MKILHTNFHRGWGGQSNRILVVSRELSQRGHEVVIAAPRGSKLVRRAKNEGIRTFEEVQFARGFRPHRMGRDIIGLRGLFRREGFDIIHTHGSQDSWSTSFALIGIRPRPFVIRTKHNMFPIRDHLFNRWLYSRATDRIVCISRAIRDYCGEKPYLRSKNTALIPSAVNPARFREGKGEKIRGELGLKECYVSGITGRLRPEKGHVFLFDAFSRIAEQVPDMVLLVVGTGSLDGELREKAHSLGLEKRILFTGFRRDIPDILAGLDLFIMPSVSEGLGTAILEAGASGLPIIASRVGGIPDIVEQGETGLLVPPGDPALLAEAVLSLYHDRDLAGRLGNAARLRVESRFSEKMLGEKTESLYRECMELSKG